MSEEQNSTVEQNAEPVPAHVVNDIGMSEEDFQLAMETDPEFAEMVRASEDEDKGGEGDHSDDPDDPGDSDDSSAGEDDEGEGGEADDDDSGDTNADTDESDEGATGSDDDFADDVIEGLKGEELKKLSEDGRAALGEFYQKAKEFEEKATSAETRLNTLLDDPVVKARAQAIDGGDAAKMFSVRGLTNEEKTSIKGRIQQELDLDDDEATKLFSLLDGGIEQVARDMANDMAYNAMIQDRTQREAREYKQKAHDVFKSLHQFNPELKVEEQDLSKLFSFGQGGKLVVNKQHPEAEKFEKGIGKFIDLAVKEGMRYDQIVKKGAKRLYADFAAALDMPISLDNASQLRKIQADAKKKALSPFLKNRARTLDTEGGNADRRKAEKTVLDSGVDVMRLANDANYYEQQLNRKPGDEAWMEKLDRLMEKGEALSKKRR